MNFEQRVHTMKEGVGIALDSIQANKVRAGLTILGIAVGVFVVVVISAAIHGINDSVAKDFESAGPTTFFLSRFPITFERCDGTDATCKWLRNPPLSLADVEVVSALPGIRTAGARIDSPYEFPLNGKPLHLAPKGARRRAWSGSEAAR